MDHFPMLWLQWIRVNTMDQYVGFDIIKRRDQETLNYFKNQNAWVLSTENVHFAYI